MAARPTTTANTTPANANVTAVAVNPSTPRKPMTGTAVEALTSALSCRDARGHGSRCADTTVKLGFLHGASGLLATLTEAGLLVQVPQDRQGTAHPREPRSGRRLGPSPRPRLSPGGMGAMAAALIDGTPWPCDVARAGQGDRPSSVGKDGRSWGMVVPPDRPAVRGGPGGGLLNGTSDCSRGGLPARPGVTSEEPARVRLLGATTEARAPYRVRETKAPRTLQASGGWADLASRRVPPANAAGEVLLKMLGRRFTRRLWPGRVNLTLGCQRQH